MSIFLVAIFAVLQHPVPERRDPGPGMTGARIVVPNGVGSASTADSLPLTSSAITAADLRRRLFLIAADSMMGRRPGDAGNYQATEYIAAEFKRVGLSPAGENGGYFQSVPLFKGQVDPASVLAIDGTAFAFGTEWLVPNLSVTPRSLDDVTTVFAGTVADSAHWPDANAVAGHAVLVTVGRAATGQREYVRWRTIATNPRLRRAAVVLIAERDLASPELVFMATEGAITMDTTHNGSMPPVLLLTPHAAQQILGDAASQMRPGATGRTLHGRIANRFRPLAYAARNVVAVLRGSDPALAGTYVSLSAHNDHVGFNHAPVNHDSIRAYLRVKRPKGADTPDSPVTSPQQNASIRQILDSLRANATLRLDSIYNGADDDGSGTVALLEIGEELASRAARPRRSILFVSHTAEEYGLVGSAWYTDHATVPIDSIVGEIDVDMIGRGQASDLAAGGPTYLESVGSRRLSAAFGRILEAVNARQPQPFVLNYEFDAPGHPSQYYCRADHYSYARYGIPSVSLSRGGHSDYHQVTDEPQYIDYDDAARVAFLVRDMAIEVANRLDRPALDGPRGDPHAVCRQ